ncbi:hypothetical protein [Pseudarthrobacter sp. 1C304]|uniref:hypothetical protein n=1 Tax=Pseudarthrobacter sp. 1C304 TaxID=3457438 RepID=UPI003FD0177E
MSGRGTPPRPDRVQRFSTWAQVPLQDLLTLRRSLRQSAAAVTGPAITIESELLSIVDDEVIRRGLKAAEESP